MPTSFLTFRSKIPTFQRKEKLAPTSIMSPVEQAAIAIIETAPLFLTPGRVCQNGLPVPVDRPDWKKYTTELMEIGRIAKQAAIARKLDAFEEISEKLSDACQNCHRVYRRDAPGAMRCQ